MSALVGVQPQPAEPDITRRSAIFGAGCVLTAAAAAVATPHIHEATLAGMKIADCIPRQVGSWVSRPTGELIVPDAAVDDGIYDQVASLIFSGPNLPEIMLLVAYGAAQSGLMKVHRPEVCYASSGFTLRDDRPIDVPLAAGPSIPAKTFQARREDRLEQVLYWTRVSRAFPRNLDSERLVVLQLGLRGVIPDGVLVRISMLGEQGLRGAAMMSAFARQLIADAGAPGRALLIGRSRAEPRGMGG